MSTSTSANCTPLVPLADRPGFPLAVDRDRFGAEQAAGFFPGRGPSTACPSTTMRPSLATSAAGCTPIDGATRAGKRVERLAWRDADCRRDGRGRRAAAAAAAERIVAVADLRLDRRIAAGRAFRPPPSPRSCACRCRYPACRSARPRRRPAWISTCAFVPRPPPPHWLAAQPMPRLIGPGVGSPVGWRFDPAELLGGDREVLPPHRVRRFGRQVLHPELDRVHPDLVGELVHQHLGVEAPLRMARRAHRARRARVRVHVAMPAAAVRERVDVRQREARADARRRPCPTISASNAVSVPSAATPALIFENDDGRLPAARCSSLRSSISFTGRARLLRELGADDALRRRDRTCCRTRRPCTR